MCLSLGDGVIDGEGRFLSSSALKGLSGKDEDPDQAIRKVFLKRSTEQNDGIANFIRN